MPHKKLKTCVNCKNSYRVHYNHTVLYRCKVFDYKVVNTSDNCKEYEER